jgi:hypothetical protein
MLAASCRAKSDERFLTGPEIQTLFAGKTVTGRHEIHGYSFKSYYEPAGRYRSYQNDSKTPRRAKWWVAGDDICVRWDDTPEDLCRKMVIDAQRRYKKVLLVRGSQKLVVTFHSFTPGNPDKL